MSVFKFIYAVLCLSLTLHVFRFCSVAMRTGNYVLYRERKVVMVGMVRCIQDLDVVILRPAS